MDGALDVGKAVSQDITRWTCSHNNHQYRAFMSNESHEAGFVLVREDCFSMRVYSDGSSVGNHPQDIPIL